MYFLVVFVYMILAEEAPSGVCAEVPCH